MSYPISEYDTVWDTLLHLLKLIHAIWQQCAGNCCCKVLFIFTDYQSTLFRAAERYSVRTCAGLFSYPQYDRRLTECGFVLYILLRMNGFLKFCLSSFSQLHHAIQEVVSYDSIFLPENVLALRGDNTF